MGPDRITGDGLNVYVTDNGIRKISFAASSQLFSLSLNGGMNWATAFAAGPLTEGYARFQAAAGNLNPNGIAALSYRPNGVLVSGTSIQAPNLIQSGRIYNEITGAVRTAIAIENPNSSDATISFYFTDQDGVNFGSGMTTIGPNQQIAAFLNESPFNGSAAAQTFTFTSSVPIGVVAVRGFINERSDFLMTALPVAPVGALSSGPIVLPQFATGGGWTTQILLVNPTDESINGAVGMDGNFTFYSIAPRSAAKVRSNLAGSLRTGNVTVVPVTTWPGVIPLPVVSSVFTFVSGGVTVTESGIIAAGAGQSFRIFAELDSSRVMQTGIAIANADSSTATVQFELFDLAGQSTGYSGSTTLATNGHLAVYLNELPGFQKLPASFRGVLHVSSNKPIATVGARSFYNERGDFLISTIPALADTAVTSGDLLFPHLVTGGGSSTEFILMSAGSASSGTLSFRSQSGTDLPVLPSP